MNKPIILAIDDEPQVLNAVARDLQAQYQGDYQIMRAASGTEAMDAVKELKRRNLAIALFLVDQRMPNMTGIEFLTEAVKLYPEAKKVLLTAYADTDVAINSINKIDLDYYLMKPWDPPEERLYPVLDDLLDDWVGSVPIPYGGIRVVGTLWSAKSHYVKDFLARSQVPYQWLDIEKDEEARNLLEMDADQEPRFPTLFFPDGSKLVDPDLSTLANKVGMTTRAKKPYYDVIIIGAGPAGLTAAVYGASEGLKTIVIEKGAAGGQAGSSARIENFIGFPQGISGADLTRRAITQAKRLGAEILTAQEVKGIRVDGPYRYVTLGDGSELSCKTILIATGVNVRQLDTPGIDKLIGASVYYGAATAEAAHYKGGKVFVVGGANSAGQGAMFLSRFASEVTIVYRAETLRNRMSTYLIDQIRQTDNINILTNTELTSFIGEPKLEEITLFNKKNGKKTTEKADAVFIFIGAVPSTEIAGDLVQMDPFKFILTGPDLFIDGKRPKNWNLERDPFILETNVPGIFAAGDVRHGAIRRVASAFGQGAVAVSLIHKYLETV
ncbi:MAG: fused response regulator/thioredoxin-disulfide reductase [Desulfuromonas sp.]|nr:MAG: fused response regulator/thioredoxin-disulfide reductase [Desulfuromonas sp.]